MIRHGIIYLISFDVLGLVMVLDAAIFKYIITTKTILYYKIYIIVVSGT